MKIASLYPCPYDTQDRHEHNASILDGERVFAYEEGKLTSVKNDGTGQFPERSLMSGLKELNILPSEIDHWVFPIPKRNIPISDYFQFFNTILKAYTGNVENFESWFHDRVHFVPHHLAHVALAVETSSFQDCLYFSQDGGGDFGDPRDFLFGKYNNGTYQHIAEHHGLKTICSFHAFITDALGFSGGDNGKTSGLSGYGRVIPDLYTQLSTLISNDPGGITFHRERFERTSVNLEKVRPSEYDRAKIFNQYPSNTNVTQMVLEYLPQDIAATGERLVQDMFLKLIEPLSRQFKNSNAVFSGGLFQNVSLNHRILESKLFNSVHFPMAPSDGGLSLGQAFWLRRKLTPNNLKPQNTQSAYIGPSFSTSDIEQLLKRFRLHYERVNDIALDAAKMIINGRVVGWFQSRGEFGPRSLGARSILADARSVESKSKINQLMKKRDWFMPYAPSVCEEDLANWVTDPLYSPYMQIAFRVKPERHSDIPSGIHVDGTSRFHVVRKKENPLYWQLIQNIKTITGVGVVLNTSFNRHGIATISTPRQAIEHLLEGCMDVLYIDSFKVEANKNRLFTKGELPISDESSLLRTDCIQRIGVIKKMGSSDQLNKYINHLSSWLQIPISANMSKEDIQAAIETKQSKLT